MSKTIIFKLIACTIKLNHFLLFSLFIPKNVVVNRKEIREKRYLFFIIKVIDVLYSLYYFRL